MSAEKEAQTAICWFSLKSGRWCVAQMSWKILYTWSCCVSSATGSMGLLLQVFPASSTICLTHSCSTYAKRKVMKTLNEVEPLRASPTAAIHPYQPTQRGTGWETQQSSCAQQTQLARSSQANRSKSTSHVGTSTSRTEGAVTRASLPAEL